MSEKRPRGFAAMTPEQRQKCASLGGRSVPAEKRSFSTNPELARMAGRKGGQSVPSEKRSFFLNPAAAAEAGRKGGIASNLKRHSDES